MSLVINKAQAVVLQRITRRPTPATLHSREIELRLTDDGRYVMLSRYLERYGDPETAWCGVRHHRVPVARMIRWMISYGIAGAAFAETDGPRTDAPECRSQGGLSADQR